MQGKGFALFATPRPPTDSIARSDSVAWLATISVSSTRGLPESITFPSTRIIRFTAYGELGRLKTREDAAGTIKYTY